MQTTSALWKWMWADGGKGLPPAEYSGTVVSFDNPGYTYPKAATIAIDSDSGVTGATLTRCGKNLIPLLIDKLKAINKDKSWTGNTATESGMSFEFQTGDAGEVVEIRVSGTYSKQVNVALGTVKLKAGEQYILNGVSTAPSWQTFQLYVTANGNKYASVPGTQFTVNADGEYPVYLSTYGTISDAVFYPMIRLAAIADASYEPYESYATSVSFPGTVYGGTLDVINGKLTVADPAESAGTYDVAPTAIELLQGANSFWADCGAVTVALASPGAMLEAKAVIDGVEYTDISAPLITRGLMQGGLSVGNAVSATCQFSVRTLDIIAKSAEVVVKMRLTDGVTASEWLTAGTFYISHRTRDPITNVLSLECYDALLKGNAELKQVPWTTNTGEIVTNDAGEPLYFSAGYPRRMDMLLEDILLLLGLELDPRTQIETGESYTVADPGAGATINTVLGLIAAAHGGNWIITPEGRLRLVPVVSAANAASAEDAVDVLGVTGQMAVNGGGTVTGIRYTVDGESRIAGNDTGIVIDAEVSEAVASALLAKLGGVTYQSYELRGAVYDPAAELGDYVRAGANGEVASVLYMESASLGPAFRGDISAPEAGELADEYPYIGVAQRNYNRALQYADAAAARAEASANENTARVQSDLSEAIDDARQVAAKQTNQLDLSLTQQEIFDRLTDGGLEQGLALEATTNEGPSAAGEKKLFLNLDYARFGKLVADFIQGGTLKLGGLDNISGQLAILDENGNQIGVWDNEKLKLGKAWNFVQLYGPAEYNGVTAVTPFYAVQTYNGGSPFEMMLKEAMLVLLRGSSGLQLNPDSIAITEDKGNGYEADLEIAANYLAALMGGTFTIQVDNGVLDFVVNGLSINGTAGASGSFTTADGKTVTVTNGLITRIA